MEGWFMGVEKLNQEANAISHQVSPKITIKSNSINVTA